MVKLTEDVSLLVAQGSGGAWRVALTGLTPDAAARYGAQDADLVIVAYGSTRDAAVAGAVAAFEAALEELQGKPKD